MMRGKPLLFVFGSVVATSLLFAQSPAPKKNPSPPKSAPAKEGLASGKKLYDAQCAICHFNASTAKKIGPGLKGLSRRGTFADGKPVTDDSLRVWIENGGKNMPAFKGMLRAEEIRALVAYTKAL